jgi:hypothetical protein
MAGKMIQPRFALEVMERIEKRARELGFIFPSGGTNLSAYVKHCVMQDLNNQAVKLDGEFDDYKVK